jgi:hypothetical protein
MDLAALPDDFFVTVSQFTKTTYRDEYPEVDPTSKALSLEGKVVVITGTSQGIGRHVRTSPFDVELLLLVQSVRSGFFRMFRFSADWPIQGIAPAFAKANAKAIVLVARNEVEVEATGRDIKGLNPKVQVLTQALDIRDKSAVEALFAKIKSEFGTVDVLINNAGSGKSALPIKDVGPEDFWYDFVSKLSNCSSSNPCFMSVNFQRYSISQDKAVHPDCRLCQYSLAWRNIHCLLPSCSRAAERSEFDIAFHPPWNFF